MRLHWTPRAKADIAAIHDYIAEHNPHAATKVIARIRQSAALLADYPGVGRDTDIVGIRVLPVVRYPYLVYHRIGDDEVAIVHIRHGAREAPSPDEF